jgi:hypothetical protein
MVLLFMVVRELRAIRRTVDAMDGTRRRNHGRVAEADPAAEPRVRAMVEQYGRTEAAHRLATSLGIDGATAVLLVDRALAEDADGEPGQDEGRVVPD